MFLVLFFFNFVYFWKGSTTGIQVGYVYLTSAVKNEEDIDNIKEKFCNHLEALTKERPKKFLYTRINNTYDPYCTG